MILVPMSRDTRQLARLFDDTLERFFNPGQAQQAAETNAKRSPALDVTESDQAYTIKLEMPGVAKEDVKISVEGRQVSVQAQARTDLKQTEIGGNGSSADNGERVVYRERSACSYARSFTLPMEVEQSEAEAKLEAGVLSLRLPKRNARAAAQITVN